MNKMAIDVDKGIAFPGVYDVIIEDLVIKSPRSGYRSRHMVELSGGQETVSENPRKRSIKRWEDGLTVYTI